MAVLLAMQPGSRAIAACDATNQFAFSYSSRTAATLAYGTTYTYSATNGAGATRTFTVNVSQNGLSSTQAAGLQLPLIGTLVTGANTTANTLVFGGTFGGRTTSISGSTRVITMTVTFSQPVRDFALSAYDIDFTSNQFRDWVQVTGTDGSNIFAPVLATPWGNGNGTAQARTVTGSSLTSGAATTPFPLTSSQVVGSGASDNNSDIGTLNVSFAQPVTSITFKYGNYPLTTGETATGQQAIGIGGFSFCPMPNLALSKTSVPAAGEFGAYNIPGNDVIYTLTLANGGGSPADGGSVVLTDTLPAGVTFRNSAFDGTTILPLKVLSGGGTTLAAAGITYRKAGDTAFTYSPVAGYDPLVDAIRIAPTGELAANSALQVQFVAQLR